MLKQIALKIDVDTYRGTREGVPNLVSALQRHQAQASFFFVLGADRSGRVFKHLFKPGFFHKAKRIAMFQHYGFKTLLYGTLLPAPDVGEKCAGVMRAVRDAGFEVGMHGKERLRWQHQVRQADENWTQKEMQKAVTRFTQIFGVAPKSHAAAGWQTNRFALRHTQHLGLEYSTDTRGTHPFIPTWDAEIVACPQLPTTLPTLDELIGRDGITQDNVAQHILALTRTPSPTGHVFNLRAEFEGQLWLPIFEQLLQGWREQGYDMVALHTYLKNFSVSELPRHEVRRAILPGQIEAVSVQG